MDVAVNLAVSENANFEATLAEAEHAGLRVTQAFDGLGIVSGRIDPDKLASLARIAGVVVESDREVRVAAN